MQIFNILRNAVLALRQNYKFAFTLGLFYGFLINGSNYVIDIAGTADLTSFISPDSTASVIASAGLVLILILLSFFVFSPFEILFLRALNADLTDHFQSDGFLESVLKYTVRFIGIFIISAIVSVAIWSMLPVLGTELSYDLISVLPITEHPTYLLELWLTEHAFIFLIGVFIFLLGLPLIAIALGHTVDFRPALRFQLRYIVQIIGTIFVFDTVFFVLHVYVADAFDRLYSDLSFSASYFVPETLLVALYGLLFYALLSEYYRKFHNQAFENTKAASKAASVFE